MKDKFFGFYPAEEKEIENIWKNAIISFDANTLLNLYRYSKNTRNDFLKTIKEYSARIWLPYQAGYEFHNNRISVIKSQEEMYVTICKEIDRKYINIENDLNTYKRHPFIKIEKILSEIKDEFEKIKNDLLELSKEHPLYLESDEILPSVTNLFNGRVGSDFSESELQRIYEEGEIRYKKRVPPGFSDIKNKKDKEPRSLYGDLIIWKQLISKAKESKSTIIFVTDDRKEDWWLKFKGKTISPRQELIKEFYDETGLRILIYQADSFLNFAKEKLHSKVKDTSIKEVEQVRIDDERTINAKNYGLMKKVGLSWVPTTNRASEIAAAYESYYESLERAAGIDRAAEIAAAHESYYESLEKAAGIERAVEIVAAYESLKNTAVGLDRVSEIAASFERAGISQLEKVFKSGDELNELENTSKDVSEPDKQVPDSD